MICNYSISAQDLNYSFVSGSIVSSIKKEKLNPENLIEDKNKVGYFFQFELNKRINKKLTTLYTVGYKRLGSIELIDQGYSQDNIDLAPYYPKWSVVREKAYLKFNYYSLGIGGLYLIKPKLHVGLAFNLCFLSEVNKKRKFYVSDQSADYSQIFWEKNITPELVQKFVALPEISTQFEMTDKLDLRLSYFHSINSVYRINKEYHQGVSISLICNFKQ